MKTFERPGGISLSDTEKRAAALHAPMYLTLIAIIQSFAIGYLLYALTAAPLERFLLIHWIRMGCVFLLIVGTWHAYVDGVTFYQWVYDFSDSLIPFSFSVAQFLLINSILDARAHAWFYAMGAFCVVAGFAYFNEDWKANRHSPNREAAKILQSYRWLTRWFIAFSIGAFISMGVFVQKVSVSNSIKLGLVIVSALAVLFFVVETRLMAKKIVRTDGVTWY